MIPTRWTDFDALGHLTHAAYPVFLDEARDAFLAASVGLIHGLAVRRRPRLDRLSARGQVPGAVRNRANRPSRPLAPRASRSPSRSLGRNGEVAAEGQAVVVAFDPETRSARPIGDEDRALLASVRATEQAPIGEDRDLMKTIIVGYDGTSSAEQALGRAVELARAFGGKVTVVSVVAPHPIDMSGARIRADALLDVRGRSRRSPHRRARLGAAPRARRGVSESGRHRFRLRRCRRGSGRRDRRVSPSRSTPT